MPQLAGVPNATDANAKYKDILHELQQQRADLLRAGGGKPRSTGIEVEVYPDLNDQASAEVDQHFLLSLKERDRNLLKQIDAALDRLARNRYGTCESCGEDIPLKRLKARPMTTLCVECKTAQEYEEGMRH